ncbi:Cupin fold metalloprotein, WbuC family [Burkholderiales bacterium]
MTWLISKDESYYRFCSSGMISACEIADLEIMGMKSSSGRARLCLHSGPDDHLHIMLIYHDQRTNVPIHRHQMFGEQIIMERGELKVEFFDESLTLTKCISLGKGAHQTRSIWIPPSRWHLLSFLEPCLFLEISIGAMHEKKTDFANCP